MAPLIIFPSKPAHPDPRMADTSYLLIGGGLVASRAARQIRKRDPERRITLVGAEPHAPYDRPPLSKEFLRGEKAGDELLFDTAEELEQSGIELELGTVVRELDAHGKRVRLDDGATLSFDKALIATGGRPRRLELPGGDLGGIHYLRTVDDAAAIAEAARAGGRAAIVGAGFIGMEAAASLTKLGVAVTVLEAEPRVWARFADETLSGFFQDYCARKGVTFRTGVTVTGFHGSGRVQAVTVDGQDPVPCDFALVAVGIQANTELARAAGLAVSDGIVVNERLQTSHPEIYAGGDVANYPDPVFGKRRRVEHWGHAEHCGQVAGRNMAGDDQPYDLLTYVWSDIFDLHLEFAGDETEYDRVLVRGLMDDARFTVLFLKDDRLTAYFSINGNPRDFLPLKKLIRQRADLAGQDDVLTDPNSALKALL